MNKVRIITDSNSGILQSEAESLDIVVIPMPFTVNSEEYLEDISITQDEFYAHLENNADVKTSQPSQYYLEELWKKELENYDEILYIPMSSGLSKTCENAKNYADKYNGKVSVVDNHRISVTLKTSVLEAIEFKEQGLSASEIKDILERDAYKSSIYITMGVLKYLKKGGRIKPAAAAIGDMLKLKPVLSSNGDTFDKFTIAMSLNQAKKKMIAQIKSELEGKFSEEYSKGLMSLSVAHTYNEQEAMKFKEDIMNALPDVKFNFVNPLSLSVACHIGPGALAIAICIDNRK